MIRRSLAFAVCTLCLPVLPAVGDDGAQPFVMPVKATAFEIHNQELLRMGEGALSNRDYGGAIGYFHELREKLWTGKESSDHVLAGSLLAEACNSLPAGSQVSVKGPKGTRLNVTEVCRQILGEGLSVKVQPAVLTHRQFVCGKWHLKEGRHGEASGVLSALWGTDKPAAKVRRLGDLHNWILLMYMQSVAAEAELADHPNDSFPRWKLVKSLSRQLVMPLPSEACVRDDARAQVTVQAGSVLSRAPRLDVLEGEFIRLRAQAMVQLNEFSQAEAELKKPAMSMFAADRNLMLLCCLARQGRLAEAAEQLKHCEREYGGKSETGWRQALWAMFSMYYSRGRFDEAEPYLIRLESLLRPQERHTWLMLRLSSLRGRLERLLLRVDEGGGEALLVSSLDALYNSCMKYSALFPEPCQAGWLSLIKGLSAERKTDYYDAMSRLLYLLGTASHRAGNVNSAIEIYGRIGRSSEVSDALRYRSLMSLGEISASDIRGSIDAFKSCVALQGITDVQRAASLYKAAQRALQEASRGTAAAAVRESMGKEAESLLKSLCLGSAYSSTVPGREAAYNLAEFLYGRGRYMDAATYYERYFMGAGVDLGRRDLSRLRWSRCWRLLAESSDSVTSDLRKHLLKSSELLGILRRDAEDSELCAQAYLESYRVALALGDTVFGMKMLDSLISKPLKAGERRGESFWIGLYERALCHYQRNEFDAAVSLGKRFMQEREAYGEVVPWEQEFWLLLGDTQACRRSWGEAAEMYGKVSLVSRATSASLLAYGSYEESYCLFMSGRLPEARKVLEDFFVGKPGLSKEYTYRSAMLLGDVLLQQGEYMKAREQYVRAQAVYGTSDTFRSHVAMCRQGEMFLMCAEAEAQGGYEQLVKSGALSNLERASEIFGSLLKSSSASGTSMKDQDHYLDLLLRAQYRLGKCYELLMLHGKAEQAQESREQALWCYQRVCDYFMERAKSRVPVASSRYYVKSLDRRVKLLTGTEEAVSHDTMELVARLYDEYASLGLSGSVVARKRAEAIRKNWR